MRRVCALDLLALSACGNAHGGNASSGSAGTSSGPTSGPTSGSSGGNGATSSGTTSGSSIGSGAGGPYEAFDAGPHHIRFPDAVAADAGCTIGAPVLDDAGQCVQCASDSDCPAPLVCELGSANDTRGLCGQCSQAEQICPTGQFCDLSDQCLPDCTVGSPCLTPLGGYCSEPIGCEVGCGSAADCPTENPICDSSTGLCGPCLEGSPGSAGGCPAGKICGYRYQYVSGFLSPYVPACVADCRVNPGSCRPGICDDDAGSCVSGACLSDSDCAGSDTPDCSEGRCQQCLTDSECLALGIGAPVCSGGSCSASCSGDPSACGTERCAVVMQFGFPVDECVCTADGDCAGQALAASCIPMTPDAGIDADAGLHGSCGCLAGGCDAGMVCETRPYLLPPGAPAAVCIPSCASGKVDCASEGLNCDTSTGYCVACGQDSQCDADAGQPVCVLAPGPNPLGGGTCGCTSSSCESGEVCDPSAGDCHPPCAYSADGFDTCLDEGNHWSLCNSETGLCQQCFEAADCVGQTWLGFDGISHPFPFCSDAGRCSACNTYRDCPAGFPGCSGGVCGACATTADCAAGFACSPWGSCLTACDGGNCDPDGGSPLCSAGVCVQCVTSADCSSLGFGFICGDGICLRGS